MCVYISRQISITIVYIELYLEHYLFIGIYKLTNTTATLHM